MVMVEEEEEVVVVVVVVVVGGEGTEAWAPTAPRVAVAVTSEFAVATK